MANREEFRQSELNQMLGSVSSSLLAGVSGALIFVPLAWMAFGGGDPLAHLPHANEGALEGGDPFINNARLDSGLQRNGSYNVPTDARPSPLFGAEPFTQALLREEEFGVQPMPGDYEPHTPLPLPRGAQAGPAPQDLSDFLEQPLYPEPTRLSNDTVENPWKECVEEFLGRDLASPPYEGRPGGEGWAHQRWEEFAPEVWFQSAQAPASRNTGFRDALQRHGFAVGEWAPGGLYHNTREQPGFEGTNRDIAVRFHPKMPEQEPNAVWTFDGTLPPKLLMARYGEPLLFRHYNALPCDPSANFGFGLHTITTHEHNGHNPAESDGFANAFFFPGQFYDYRWPVAHAGFDTINTAATDARCGSPDGAGGIKYLKGDWRETMSSHWFHDHMLDFTAQNVYKGNAAQYNMYSSLDRGNEAVDDGVNLRFPSGSALDWGNRDYDVNLTIMDKAWTKDGQLWFNIFNKDGFLGDQVLVNWVWKPYFKVRERRYRFRILNASVSRYFKLGLMDSDGEPVPFHLIANDGNIMEHTVHIDGSNGTTRGVLPTQSIAERYDIVVDFGQFEPGDKLYLVNLMEHKKGRGPEKDPIPMSDVADGSYQAIARDRDGDRIPDIWTDGDPCVGKIMEFRVCEYGGTDLSMDPADYEEGGMTMIPVPRPTATELANARHRTFEFGRSSGTDEKPWTIKTDGGDGLAMDPRRLSAAPAVGDLEIWKIRNGGNGWSHPVHIHFEEGIILHKDDDPPPIWERFASKDVYRIGPEVDSCREMEIALRFREFGGTYMEHCHNTQHEDHAMLLRWDIQNPGSLTLMPCPIPTWDGCEHVDTVALPTTFTGDGIGPESNN